MSALLDEIIAARKARAIEYEKYLKRIADLARKVEAGLADDTPEPLKRSAALRALFNNLKQNEHAITRMAEKRGEYGVGRDPVLDLALRIDETIRNKRPDGWRGIQTRENVIKAALLPLLDNDVAEVERIFLIIKAQREY